MSARGARVLARAPLAAGAAQGDAPYWMIHRGDLQAALLEAVRAEAAITLHLGARVDDFVLDEDGVTIPAVGQHHGCALIAADGLWSRLRARLGHRHEPRFGRPLGRRAPVPADAAPREAPAPAGAPGSDGDNHPGHDPVRRR